MSFAFCIVFFVIVSIQSTLGAKCLDDAIEPVAPIKIGNLSWLGAKVNAMIGLKAVNTTYLTAKILLEEVVGIPVQLYETKERNEWEQLSKGDLHIVFELWTGANSQYKIVKYIQEEQTVIQLGPLGVIGQVAVGWYTFGWVIERWPQLASSSAFTDPQNCEIVGGKFIGGSEKYTPQVDKEIIQRYGYCLSGPDYSDTGDERRLEELIQNKYMHHEPWVGYFWTPHPLIRLYNLTRIDTPRDIDSKAYVRDILLKIAWSGLREMSPSAFFFATAFFYNTSTQISIMVSTGAQTLEEATCQWVRENRNTWKNWILPMEDIPEWLDFNSTGGIVMVTITIITQVLVAITILLVFWKRYHPYIRANSAEYQITSLVGALIMTSVSYWLLGPAEFVNCAGALVVSGVGCTIFLSAIAVKEYRIYKVFLQNKLKLVRLSSWDLFLSMAFFVGTEVVIIVLWLTVKPFDVSCAYCAVPDGTFLSLFIFNKASTLLLIIFLAWRTRQIPNYAEGKPLVVASVLLGFFSIAFIILIFLLEVEGVIITIGVGTSAATLGFLFIIYVPKLVLTFITSPEDALSKMKSRSSHLSTKTQQTSATTSGTGTGTVVEAADNNVS